MIVRPTTVADIYAPEEPEIIAIIDPMEAFLVECQIEFDRLMREDTRFREFMTRQRARLETLPQG